VVLVLVLVLLLLLVLLVMVPGSAMPSSAAFTL
jgi:hypothetical protein